MKITLTDRNGDTIFYENVSKLEIDIDKDFDPAKDLRTDFNPHILRFRGRRQWNDSLEDHTIVMNDYIHMSIDIEANQKLPNIKLMVKSSDGRENYTFHNVKITRASGITYRTYKTKSGFSVQLHMICRSAENDMMYMKPKDMAHIETHLTLFIRAINEKGELVGKETDTVYTAVLCGETP